MLAKLQLVASEGSLQVSHAYLGHIKKEEDRKVLTHAEALKWEDVEPSVRAILEQYLFQAIEGAPGEVNFACMYTGEVLSIGKVASTETDRTQNRPAVEVLEAMRDLRDPAPASVVELGNLIAYKVMAAGAIKNHLVCVLKFAMVPQLGAAPVHFVFATIVDLDDREESLFDENKGKFVVQELHNVVKKGSVSRAVFFPCLDDEGKEAADLMVYAGMGAGAWFKALEATRRFSPRKEGQALVKMITEQNDGEEVPHDLFRQMGEHLLDSGAEGLPADEVATSLEKAMGHGIDRTGFQARWENAFGELSYKPAYESLFGGDIEKPARMKMKAGEIDVTLTPALLENFRQVTVGDQTFILFAVPEQAKVVVGKDLNLHIKPVSIDQLRFWLLGESE